MVSNTPRPHFTPGKDPVPILQETGWAPGPVWTGAENLVPTGIVVKGRHYCLAALQLHILLNEINIAVRAEVLGSWGTSEKSKK